MNEKKPPGTGYELIDTCADLGFITRGADLGELFLNAFAALDFLLFPDREAKDFNRTGRREVSLSAPGTESLLIDFLNRLLYLVYAESQTVTSIEIRDISPVTLNLIVHTIPWTRPPRLEIKAATHHLLHIIRKNSLLEARVFLDI